MTVAHPVRPAAGTPGRPRRRRAPPASCWPASSTATPMANARALSELCAGPVLLKCENLQRTGLVQDPRRVHADRPARRRRSGRGASSPPARATTRRASRSPRTMLGVAATVFMPERAALPKVGATRGLRRGRAPGRRHHRREPRRGARVRRAHRRGARAPVRPRRRHRRPGHGRARDRRAVPGRGAPCSSRSAAAGCWAGSPRPCPTGCGWSACRPPARRRGRRRWPRSAPTALPAMRTLADGIAVGRPGDVTFPQVTALVDEIVTVDDDALSRALLHCLERAKLLVEPAGAAAVAALLEHPRRFPTPAVAVLSGGNVDPLVLGHVIRHGMAVAARYVELRHPDRGPPRRARGAAGADRGAGGERARRRALADLGGAAPRRGRRRGEPGDPRHRAPRASW